MLPTATLSKFEKYLLLKKSQIEDELKNIERDDPVMLSAALASSEMGDASWEADVHAKAVVARSNLLNFYSGIKRSLNKLHQGTYGKCEKCGKLIEPQRLEVLPIATLCTLCL